MLFLFFDARSSFNLDSKLSESMETDYVPPVVSLPIMRLSTFNALKVEFSAYEQLVDTTPINAQGMSKEQQLKQKGVLFSFFVGQNKLQLKAIIDTQNKPFALVQVENLETNIVKMEKFINGQIEFEYQVSIPNANEVHFSNENHKVVLVMYAAENSSVTKADKE